jgi:hypothetical protein
MVRCGNGPTVAWFRYDQIRVTGNSVARRLAVSIGVKVVIAGILLT